MTEKDILTQSHALSVVTNERTIQLQAAQNIYIERPDPSFIFQQPKYDKSQSLFGQDPRAVLYKFYNKNLARFLSADRWS